MARISELRKSKKGRVKNNLRLFAVSSAFPLLTNYSENRFVNQNRVQYEEKLPSLSSSATIIIVRYKEHHHRHAFCLCPLHSIEKGVLGGLHLHDLSSVTPKVI